MDPVRVTTTNVNILCKCPSCGREFRLNVSGEMRLTQVDQDINKSLSSINTFDTYDFDLHIHCDRCNLPMKVHDDSKARLVNVITLISGEEPLHDVLTDAYYDKTEIINGAIVNRYSWPELVIAYSNRIISTGHDWSNARTKIIDIINGIPEIANMITMKTCDLVNGYKTLRITLNDDFFTESIALLNRDDLNITVMADNFFSDCLNAIALALEDYYSSITAKES